MKEKVSDGMEPEYDEGVYMQARLNSNDSDAFSGYWNPDDAQY